MSETVLEFETFPSDEGRLGYKQPWYQRVREVKASDRSHLVLPHPVSLLPGEVIQLENTETFEREVPKWFKDRLFDYGATRFLGEDLPFSEHPDDQRDVRSCYDFALYMGGLHLPEHTNLIRARQYMDRMMRTRMGDHGPGLGRMCVIGYPEGYQFLEAPNDESSSCHAFIGFQQGVTLEKARCMQIMAVGGQLGFVSLGTMLEYHRDIMPTIPPEWWKDGLVPKADDINPYEVWSRWHNNG